MPRLVTIGPLTSVAGHLAVFEDANGRYLADGGLPSGTGTVVGPGTATDNAIARYDGTTGQLLQNSGITIADGASGTLNGSNSGDVTLAGLGYLSIAAQVITALAINLASMVTGRLPFANFTAATAASVLLGRRSGSSGDFEEVTLGTGLSMSGTVLSASASGGGTWSVLTNGDATNPDLMFDSNGDVLMTVIL